MNISRYIHVTDVHGNEIFGVYMSKVGNISEEIRIPQGKYEVLNIHRLSISKDEFERISKYDTSISHEATRNWDSLIDKALENDVDLIMFYNGHKKVYYTFAGIYRVYQLVWNKTRTSCKKKPCIRILLENLIAIE
jgi:hypothetical protein